MEFIVVMYYVIIILNVNNNDCWKEPFKDWEKARKRVVKLRYSNKLKIISIECPCADDEQELWDIYNR